MVNACIYEYCSEFAAHRKCRSIKMCASTSHQTWNPNRCDARAILFMFMNFKSQKSNAIWGNLFFSCYRWNGHGKRKKTSWTETEFLCTEIDILLGQLAYEMYWAREINFFLSIFFCILICSLDFSKIKRWFCFYLSKLSWQKDKLLVKSNHTTRDELK